MEKWKPDWQKIPEFTEDILPYEAPYDGLCQLVCWEGSHFDAAICYFDWDLVQWAHIGVDGDPVPCGDPPTHWVTLPETM